MIKAYKYQIYPSEVQKKQLQNCFGSVRFIYNLALETKDNAYKSAKINLSYYDLAKQLTELKTEFDWLFDCPNMCLQSSIRNLDTAYTNFYKGRGKFPTYKNKKSKNSIQFPQNVKIDFEKQEIIFPKIGAIGALLHREFDGKVKTVTLSKTPTNKYFASVLVDNGQELPQKVEIKQSIGIDLGLKTFAFTSDNKEFENQKFLDKNLKRLRIEQRTMARRFKKGVKEQSKNWHKQKLVVAKLHEKITNQRKDYLHKISAELVTENDLICMETLNIKGMMQNRKLSKAIGQQGWNTFVEMLKYKCENKGKHFQQVPTFYPSSKTCNCCGNVNKELKLSMRVWECDKCHTLNERDFNAALNIRDKGFELIKAA